MTIKQKRDYLRAKYGYRMYRITSDGEIHVYGQSSEYTGWIFLGMISDNDCFRD